MTEFGLIDKIAAMCSRLPDNGWEGIGDDCAVLEQNGMAMVVTADMLVEDIQVLRHAATAREIGRKSLAVNLSDVAAMGARPVATVLSLAIPEDVSDEWIEEFMDGYTGLSAEYGVALVGGDTTASKNGIVVNVTAIGTAPAGNLKRRSDASAGDIIAVTGRLGGSGAGLRDILAGRYDTEVARIHMNPEPQVAEGVWLGGQKAVHAMMDISDGVASDLRHILELSGVGADVDLDAVPAESDLHTALCAGEDYKLLLTVAAGDFDAVAASFESQFGRPLYNIGCITADNGALRWLRNGLLSNEDFQGFTHF